MSHAEAIDANIDEAAAFRDEFESWISAPPYEGMCDRYSADSERHPGQYKSGQTQLAWEAWQAAQG